MDTIVAALTVHADNLLGRMPWLVALAYTLDLPYKKKYTGPAGISSRMGYEGSQPTTLLFKYRSAPGSRQCCVVVHAMDLHLPFRSMCTYCGLGAYGWAVRLVQPNAEAYRHTEKSQSSYQNVTSPAAAPLHAKTLFKLAVQWNL